MPPMYTRPWYTKVADAAHRLSVLGIIGFSVYLCTGIGRTLYNNRDSARRLRIEQEQAAASTNASGEHTETAGSN